MSELGRTSFYGEPICLKFLVNSRSILIIKTYQRKTLELKFLRWKKIEWKALRDC